MVLLLLLLELYFVNYCYIKAHHRPNYLSLNRCPGTETLWHVGRDTDEDFMNCHT